MKRNILILSVILVIQVVLSVVVFLPRQNADSESGLLFPGLSVDEIVQLTVTNSEGKSLRLRRSDGGWVMPDADDYPASTEAVELVLDQVVALEAVPLVARTASSHTRLQVAGDDFLVRLDLETRESGEYSLYLGSSPSYGMTHVRRGGDSAVYLADGLSSQDISPTGGTWVDSPYLSVDEAELSRITLENANGTFVLMRTSSSGWTLAGLSEAEEANTGNVNVMVMRATSLTLLEPLGKDADEAYGLDDPAAVVTLRVGDEEVTLLVGAHDTEDSTYVVKASTSDYYARVAGYNVQAFVENGREDLVQPPPEEEPTEP